MKFLMSLFRPTKRSWLLIVSAVFMQSVCNVALAGLEEEPIALETNPTYVRAAEYAKAHKNPFGLDVTPPSPKEVREVERLIRELKSLTDGSVVSLNRNEASYINVLIGDLYQTITTEEPIRLSYYKSAGEQLKAGNPLGSMAHARGLELLAEYNSFMGTRVDRLNAYRDRLNERNIAALTKFSESGTAGNYCRTKLWATFDYYNALAVSKPLNEKDRKFHDSKIKYLNSIESDFKNCIDDEDRIHLYREYQSNFLFLNDYKSYTKFREMEFELYSSNSPKLDRPYVEAATSILANLLSELVAESNSIEKLGLVSELLDSKEDQNSSQKYKGTAFDAKLRRASFLIAKVKEAINKQPNFDDFQEMYADAVAPISDEAQVNFANKLIATSKTAGWRKEYRLEKAYGILSGVYEKRQMLDKAIRYGQVSVSYALSDYIEAYKNIRKKFPNLSDDPPTVLYEYRVKDLQRLYQKAGRIEEAIQLSDLLKAGEYVDFSERGIRGAEEIAPMLPFTKDERDLVKSIREISGGNSAPGLVDAQIEAALMKHSSIGKNEQTQMSRPEGSRAQFLKNFGSGAAFLNYTVHKKGVSIDVVASNSVSTIFVPLEESQLDKLVFGLLQKLKDKTSDPRPLAKELYENLIAPIEKVLDQSMAKVLMVSLDGKLRYIPFAALYDGKKYAIDKWSFPFFTAQAPQKSQRADNQLSFVGFGVSKPWGSLPPLPGVKNELNRIAGPNSGVLSGEVFLDESFTEQRLKSTALKNYKIVHIASHFVFSPGTESNSYLLLGDGKKLSLADAKRSNIRFDHTDLLTLSACDTAKGGGKDANGKEIEGFGVTAQKQGASAVLATLWKVDDKATAILMADMYSNKIKGKNKIEALRQAQIELKQKHEYSHPYFWAPFILMGNWQ